MHPWVVKLQSTARVLTMKLRAAVALKGKVSGYQEIYQDEGVSFCTLVTFFKATLWFHGYLYFLFSIPLFIILFSYL